MAKVKSVKAKKVSAKVVETAKAESKVAEVTCFCKMFPNSKQGEVDQVTLFLNKEKRVFSAYSEQELPIMAFPSPELTKQLYVAVIEAKPAQLGFAYKNVYTYSFGLVNRAASSYKSVISFHFDNFKSGGAGLILNASDWFTVWQIQEELDKLGLVAKNQAKWFKLVLTEANFAKAVELVKALFALVK